MEEEDRLQKGCGWGFGVLVIKLIGNDLIFSLQLRPRV